MFAFVTGKGGFCTTYVVCRYHPYVFRLKWRRNDGSNRFRGLKTISLDATGSGLGHFGIGSIRPAVAERHLWNVLIRRGLWFETSNFIQN